MKETVLSIIKVIFAQLVLTAVAILLASFITYKLKVNDFGYKVIVMVVSKKYRKDKARKSQLGGSLRNYNC